jgi:hypothetical protein
VINALNVGVSKRMVVLCLEVKRSERVLIERVLSRHVFPQI